MTTLSAILADILASMERAEADEARVATTAAEYKGPWRRKTDVIDVQARQVDEQRALQEGKP